MLAFTCSAGNTFAKQDLLPQLKFSHIAKNELEALGHVNDIVQDHEGFMWFGTSKGLARFDGYELSIFRHKAGPKGLPSDWVERLLVTKAGKIWLTTPKGFCQYNAAGLNFRCRQFTDNKQGIEPTYDMLFEDSRGRLWLTSNTGIFTVDKNTLTPTLHPNKWLQSNAQGSKNRISAIIEDSYGQLWVGHYEAGLSRFDATTGEGRRWQKGEAGLTSNKVRSLMFDQQGKLWIGTQGAGVLLFDPKQQQATSFAHDLAEKADTVWDIHQDSRGLIWIGDGTGVHLVSPDDLSTENHRFIEGKPMTPGNYVVRAITEDKHGGIWMGFFPSGIDLVDELGSQFVNFRHDPRSLQSLPDGGVLATLETSNGELWVGAGFGLALLNRQNNSFEHFAHDPNDPSTLSGSTILDMTYGLDDTLWLGIWDRGLNRRDPNTGKFHHYLPKPGDPNSLLGREPWGLLFDSKQRLWVTTEKGLSRYRPETDDFQRYLPKGPDGKPVEALYTRHVYEDKQGNIWVSSFAGLQLVNPETGEFTTFRHDPEDPDSISSDMVSYVFEDSQNRLWIGTDGAGLNLFDRSNKRFTRYGESHGLPDLSISAIIEDQEGQIWLSTFQGLAVFDPTQGVINHYKRRHGLPGNLYNRHSAALLSSGELVFGSSEGLVIFRPSQLASNKVPPSLVFNELRIFNQTVGIDDGAGILSRHINHAEHIYLQRRQSVFSISYAALDYRSPEDNSYAYRLLGFEKDWNWVANQRSATYTNLDAGDYTLEVKAANSAGIWNSKPRRLQITIVPPWWQTPLAKGLYVLFFISVLLWFYFLQRARLESTQKQLAQEHELVLKLREVERLKDNINRELDEKVEQRTSELKHEQERLLEAHKQLAALNEKLESMSVTDQLTGLNNRRYLDQYIDDDIALVRRQLQQRKLSDNYPSMVFVLLDMDDFKSVNDTYGHDTGDKILIQLADVLRKVVRQSDHIVRWGGEEFVIVMRSLNQDDIEIAIERLRSTIADTPFDIGRGESIYKTISVGYATYPCHPQYPEALTWQQILGIADRALYCAKHSGKNGWIGISSIDFTCTEQEVMNLAYEKRLLSQIEQGRLSISTSFDPSALVWR